MSTGAVFDGAGYRMGKRYNIAFKGEVAEGYSEGDVRASSTAIPEKNTTYMLKSDDSLVVLAEDEL